MRPKLGTRQAALAIAAAAAATIGGAYVFQYGWGYVPCKLCLEQRIPYYVGIPLALATAALPPRWGRLGLWCLCLVFLVGAGLGVYHAGVEWGVWLGPSDCGGGAPTGTGNAADLLNQLQTIHIVSCTAAAWRFLGLSLAGWNALISLGLASLAAFAALKGRFRRGRQGSSSLSQ